MDRIHLAAAVSAILAVGVLPQAAAYPSLYDSKVGKCEIPGQGFDGHMTPTEDPAITFELTDAAGAAVTAWAAGAVYNLSVGPYDTTKPTNAWIHASAGTLAPADAATHASAAACGSAVFSLMPVPGSHAATWTAPADDTGCVTVSTAQANGRASGYAVGLVALPGASAPPCAAPVLTLTAEEDLIEEGASAQGSGHDDSHDEGEQHEEGAAPAAEEGAAAEEGTSGAATVHAAAAAVAAAVGGMLAMV